MRAAQVRLGIEMDINFTEWSDTWLSTAGPALIESKIEYGGDGKIAKFELQQTPYNADIITSNRLRVQRINIAALDADMKVIKNVTS
jgi:hypothetical protein